MRAWLRCLWLLSWLLLAGCTFDAPIDVSHKWTLQPGEMKSVTNTGLNKVTKVKVDVKVLEGMPVHAALVYEEHLEEAKQALRAGQEPPKQLGEDGSAALNTEDFGLTVNVEPHKAFSVVVRNPGTDKRDFSTVTVHIRSGSAIRK